MANKNLLRVNGIDNTLTLDSPIQPPITGTYGLRFVGAYLRDFYTIGVKA